MTYQRLAYDDASSTSQMAVDCRAVEEALRLPRRRTTGEAMSRAAKKPAPSIKFEDNADETPKPEIDVSHAAVRLAATLHLHLD